jgi:hypothetical protein
MTEQKISKKMYTEHEGSQVEPVTKYAAKILCFWSES